jgi:UDP-3-O-[3-hydroxymyristoyl] glucosamine N-acyltransferase
MPVDLLRLLLLRARSRGRLRFARDVRVAEGVRVTVAPGARVVLGPGVSLGPDSRIDALGGTVAVGAGARLGERAVIVSHAGVELGASAVVGDWAAVDGARPTWADAERAVREQPLRREPIRIGAGAVLGPHAFVGPGAAVAAGAVVGAYEVLPPPPVAPASRRR